MSTFTIFVDADACPKPIKEIIYRVSSRLKINILLVANQHMVIPKSPYIKLQVVGSGFDVADNYIVDQVKVDDLVITADIPLADNVITRGGKALNPRGEFYTQDNIKSRLSMRNFMSEMRDMGHNAGGPAPLHSCDIQKFANSLDQFLAKLS